MDVKKQMKCSIATAGDPDKPRILEAFNETTDDWLSFFMFTYFQDRDGKFQLAALSESGFDPLSRTCRFMLTEEAHHMFVGETGIMRIIQRTCELMQKHDSDNIRPFGGIDLLTIQKWINFHYSICFRLIRIREVHKCSQLLLYGAKRPIPRS